MFLVATLTVPFGCASRDNEQTEEEIKPSVEEEAVEVEEATVTEVEKPAEEPSAEIPPPAKPAAPWTKPSAPKAAPKQVPQVSANGKRVMYVKEKSAPVLDAPKSSARVVRTLKRGAHLLVSTEGEWGRTDDGHYISLKYLTNEGVGSSKRKAEWSGGQPGQVAPRSAKPAPKTSAPAAPNAKPELKGNVPGAGSQSAPGASPAAAGTPTLQQGAPAAKQPVVPSQQTVPAPKPTTK